MPVTDSTIDADLDTIGHVLRDRLLEVPLFQRSYSWGAEQVIDFWNDLRTALAAPQPGYFMGSIVLAPGEGGRTTVIDGQQRLATATLLLAAIRSAFTDSGDETRSLVIENEYLVSRSLRTKNIEPRLRLNPDDEQLFNSCVIDGADLDDQLPTALESHRRMREAISLLRQAVQVEVELAGSHWDERLFEWIDFLEGGVRLIVVSVPDESDAFLIFETLNDRGLALTIGDLLKNYLFGLARTDLPSVYAGWSSVQTELESARSEEVLTDFVRHYWSSRYGATRARELYQSIKRRIRSFAHATEMVGDLARTAPLYAAILSPSHEWWGEHDIDLAKVETLQLLGLEQLRPLLLAGMENLKSDQLNELMASLICWSVRGLIVGGIGGGTTERYYAEAAIAVVEHKATDVASIRGILEPIVPSDREFKTAFQTRRVSLKQLSRYYLTALEQGLTQGHSDPAVVSRDVLVARRLVSVLPRSGSDLSWSDFPSDERVSWNLRLGNQMLLRGDFPRRGFDSWEEARSILSAYGGPLGHLAAAHHSWSPKAIDTVQEAMAELALTVWPRG